MKSLTKAPQGPARFELPPGIWVKILGPVLAFFGGGARSEPSQHDSARVAERLHLHLSALSDTELADYGLRREQIAEFVKGGPIERT